ncbi:hypothetical protein H5154_21755 [Pseudoalteromonas sp. SR44-5]|uniref:hypothetical protein n=1 Tax=unclassified Pseudoalteromonas TaxID=194690 RepID=UPI00160277E8|nr:MULTISPECIES: hypothetical protein [unclassified Pseudoalteromonas]MBB1368968.1 hypothetical protein [Pseudoalteromonas sp. SR44-5]MBB1470781.1 hypothetical protein [Pseudoalteromonas sp. SG41-5]
MMAKRESRSVSGTMELDYEWEETSSGHIETESSITLSGNGSNVVLKESNSTKNFIKSNESHSSSNEYKISTSLLISLIKEHGNR